MDHILEWSPGAIIGASASVGAQIASQWAIEKREDRDRLHTAYIEFAESAFRFVQRVELVAMYSHNKGTALCAPATHRAVEEELLKLVKDAGAAQDQLTTALCKITMLRHTDESLDSGAAIYKALTTMPKAVGDERFLTLDDLTRMADKKRLEIKDRLQEQSTKLA